jgi:peptide chain release factor 2
MEKANFWADNEAAKKTVQRLKELKARTEAIARLEHDCEELGLLLQMGREEKDEATLQEVASGVVGLNDRLEKFQVEALLSGENDERNAFVAIHAGAGGTESCDWAQMLLRMYTRWCEDHDYDVKIVDLNPGEEAGIKSLTAQVTGLRAYGYLKSEIGVHRLVRISPFDANARRHTSFASVDVTPEFDEDTEIEIKEGDVRIDTYRSAGAGGQHVNVTDSAVRITHLPTGIVATCQNERSQHSNRRTAMAILISRLYRLREKEREEELAKLYGEKGDIAWGNQIRSYVLQPYTLVKDHRTGFEMGDVNKVLDGYLDPFIGAYLRWKLSGQKAANKR